MNMTHDFCESPYIISPRAPRRYGHIVSTPVRQIAQFKIAASDNLLVHNKAIGKELRGIVCTRSIAAMNIWSSSHSPHRAYTWLTAAGTQQALNVFNAMATLTLICTHTLRSRSVHSPYYYLMLSGHIFSYITQPFISAAIYCYRRATQTITCTM